MRDRMVITCLVLLAGLVSVAESGFMMTLPWVLSVNEKNWACVHLQNLTEIDLEVSLKSLPGYLIAFEKKLYLNGSKNCFSIDLAPTNEVRAMLYVVARSPGDNSSVIFEETHKLKISQEKLVILVQPDKPIYKPGQTVKFRALLFDRNYKQWTGKLDKIFITDPKRTRIVQWLDYQVDGLISLEMQLSDDPILGQWTIHIQKGITERLKTFTVEEYVLPKYELTIQVPPYLCFSSKTVDVEICAKYSYGEPVYGKVNGSICIKGIYETQNARPCFKFDEYITGCKKYSIESKKLELDNITYSLWHVYLNVNATIVEEGTGITKTEDNKDLMVSREMYKIKLHPYSRKFFKPGFPQILNIIVTSPDSQPISDLDIEVQLQNDKKSLNNYITDENGMISALIPAQPSHTTSVVVKVFPSADKKKFDEMKTQSEKEVFFHTEESFIIGKWYSPSDSFISIEPVFDKLPCTDKNTFVFFYNYNETEEPLIIHYQIISRGQILVTNSTEHSHSTPYPIQFNEPDMKAASMNKSTKEEAVKGKKTSDDNTPVYKQTVTISSKLGPDSSFIVFYIRPDGEVVSDNIKIPVENCLPNPVKMNFNKDSAKPQQHVKLSVKAAAKSRCAIAMVDKSVHILGGDNQITKEKVFQKMEKYNLPRVIPGKNKRCDNWHYPYPDYIGPPAPPPRPLVPSENIKIPATTNKPEQEKKKQKKKKRVKGEKKKNKRRENASRRQRRSFAFPDYTVDADATEAFEATGLAVLTDLDLDNKPCNRIVSMRMYYFGAPGPMPTDRPVPEVHYIRKKNNNPMIDRLPEITSTETRSFFPETWLWDIEDVGSDGMFSTTMKVPDTITTWIGNAICINKEAGIGVSDQINLQVFKPFFVSYTLPYSAVRGEKVPLLISVFNYLSLCLTVKLQLVTSEDFVVHKEPNITSVCVCSKKPETIEYVIIPQNIGHIAINVTAKAVSKMTSCSSKGVQIKQRSEDNLSRQLLVKAEGLPREYTYNSFFCLNADEDSVKVDTVRLDLPQNHLVADSSSAFVSIIGDIMGPTLSGLDHLVKMPYGCGEQNMVGFVPNIHVIRYLSYVNKKSSPLIPQAVKHMKIGYQRELQFQHKDGTFSAFGESDKHGSTWLTAFVLKSFAQAKDFIFIDESIFSKIIKWFRWNQLEIGCFHEFGKVWSSYLKGGLESNGDIPLTAYTVIALLEANVTKQETIHNAMKCLSKAEINDTYTLALVHYAYVLYGKDVEKKEDLRKELITRVVRDDGDMYWSRTNKKINDGEFDPWLVHKQAPSAEVEITSYVLLAILQDEGMSAVADSLPIVRWLTKQRNAYGGFSSTQDTVLALQALAEYAKLTFRDGLNMDFELRGTDFRKDFKLNDLNSFVLQTEDIKTLPNEIKLKANGSGCALVQMNVKYNIFEMIANTSPLSLKISLLYDEEKCDRAMLRVTVGDLSNSTNMVVAEIKLPTGWVVHRPSLKALKYTSFDLVKRTELQDGDTQVNIYFDELPTKEESFTFQIVQNIVLEETKPATSVLYYYYEKQIRNAYEYSIPTRCSKDKPTSGSEKSLAAEPKRCPVCSNTVPENVMDIFCASTAVYKAVLMVSPKSQSKLKIYSDDRPKPREILGSIAKIEIDSGCKCDHLDSPESKTLTVITTKNLYDSATKKIKLNEFATIYPNSMIKNIRKQLKKSSCEDH
ncbi:pregnancy zone protein-like [Argonauta hians]